MNHHPLAAPTSAVQRLLTGPCLLSLLLAACGGGKVEVPGPQPRAAAVPADSLYARIGEAKIEGEAAKLLGPPPESEVRTLMALDFDDGQVGLLKPFSNDKNAEKQIERLSGIETAPGSQGKALHIPGGIKGASAYRTPPIPVEAGSTFTLTYSVRTDGLEGPDGAKYRYATVEPMFFAIPSYQHDPAGVLSNPDRRKRNRVNLNPAVRGPNRTGTTAWETHTIEFTAPPTANYLMLSFDHTRTQEEKGLGKPSKGDVWFDSIKLTTVDKPLQVRYRNPDDLNQSPNPLQLRVELPAPEKGAETRYALYAPAPSTFQFQRKIPDDARLTLATGLLRDGWLPGKGGVTFKVEVVRAGGQRDTVLSRTLEAATKEKDREWQDETVDLSAYAGQDVTLELTTAADGPAGMLPGAAAIWGDPVLFSRKSQGRLVVMTIIDTVSVGHVNAYGYDRETMPNLDRIGKRGVLFERAYSAAPWTLPSIASIFTGLDAVRHGAGERAWGEVVWRRPLPERFVTLAERLRAAGFHTAAYVNNPYLTSTFGLGQGFTTYRDYGVGTRTGGGEIGTDLAIDWLKSHKGYDRFLVLHLMDAHGPYRPPARYAGKFTRWFYSGRFEDAMKGKDYLDLAEGKEPADEEETRRQVRDLYDGALLYADHQLGRLYEAVGEQAGTTDVTFVVVSDHGEELWEHGGYEHGHQAYEEMLRVPFVIENPAVFRGGRRVSTPVRLTDVVSTTLAALDLPVPEGQDGYSLLPLLKGEKAPWTEPRPIFAENELYGSAQSALIEGPVKYLYNMENSNKAERRPKAKSRYELYHLEQDPGETQNQAKAQAPTLLQMHPKLDAHLRIGMAGRYVLALDGGGKPRTFAGELKLPPGKAYWFSFYEDLIAPLADGSEGPLRVVARRDRLTFQVTSSRALLAFRAVDVPAGGGGIELTLTVDGQPWTEGVALGAGGAAGAGESLLRFSDTQLTLAPEALPAPVADRVSIFVGKTTERALGADQNKEMPAETRDRLRALGYINE